MDGFHKIMPVEKNTENKDDLDSTDLKHRKLLFLKHEDVFSCKQRKNSPLKSCKEGNGDSARNQGVRSNLTSRCIISPRLEECSDKKRFALNRSICLLPRKSENHSRCSIKSFQPFEDIHHNSARDQAKKDVSEMRQMYRRNSSRPTSHFTTCGIVSSTNVFPGVSRFQSEGEVSLINSLFNCCLCYCVLYNKFTFLFFNSFKLKIGPNIKIIFKKHSTSSCGSFL